MATIKSYTDLQQSKKLAEILPLESADMCYIQDLLAGGKYGKYKPYIGDLIPAYGQDKIKCWSLAALLDVLPKQFGRYTKSLGWFDDAWHCVYMDEDSECKYCVSADNPIDACVAMIIKLSELKML